MTANPFLFNEETYTSPSSAASNPFLMDDDPEPTSEHEFNDNPFLSQTATTMSTNPFCFDPMDLEPAEAEIPEAQHALSHNDPFGCISKESESNADILFGSTETQSTDFLVTTKTESSPLPQKPSDLNLKYSHQISGNGPPRPPPPRPPPSKETQDLLMSVMGEMDATSSSLLNKIPPTRTPSPVSMRDLHSPSPTPEPSFGDLLDVSDKTAEPVQDIFSMKQDNCDINQNPAVVQEVAKPPVPKPPRPTPPVRPPKPPLPPQISENKKSVVSNTPKPLLENNAAPTQAAEKNDNNVNEIDMFGIDGIPQKTVVTNADIMNLYNAPKQEQKPDLLTDSVEAEMIIPPSHSDNITPMSTETTQAKEDTSNGLSPVSQSNEIVKDHFLSPEPSHDDLQMDLSDSQSKESVSSVTFNPFAANDDFNNPIENSDLKNNEINQQKPMDIFDNPIEMTNNVVNESDAFGLINKDNVNNVIADTNTDIFGITSNQNNTLVEDPFSSTNNSKQTMNDDFDDFAKKFDSVKTDENKSDTVWGSEFGATNEFTQGFGQDDGFDSFLALQEPPVVPQSTPNRISKSGSQESDDDKDFSVFIR